MNRGLICLVALAIASCSSESGPPATVSTPAPTPQARSLDYVLHEEPGVPTYGLISGGPLVVVFGGALQDTLTGTNMVPIAPMLAKAGYAVMSMDLPAHGALGSTELIGWADAVRAGNTTYFTDFCSTVSKVLDHLGEVRVSVVGISRGGYIAATCGARDSRFNAIALLAPVTDLTRLTEFAGVTVDPAIYGLDQYVPILINHPILVRIGKADDRVGTDAAVAFAGKVGATLQILDVIGHSAPEDGTTLQWLSLNR